MGKLRPTGEVIGQSPQQRSLDKACVSATVSGPVTGTLPSEKHIVGFDNEVIQDLNESVLFTSRWMQVSLKAGPLLYLFNESIKS